MEAALRALLVGDTTLAGLVDADSIVWNHLPQATRRPAIALYRISGGPGIHMLGSDRLENGRVQLDIQALSVASMWAIRDAVLALMHGYRDEEFRGIFLLNQQQSDEKLTDNILIHRCRMDFDVWARAA